MRQQIWKIGRNTALMIAVLAATATLGGCGGGVADEGVPPEIDLSKPQIPEVNMPGLSTKIQKENSAKAKSSTP